MKSKDIAILIAIIAAIAVAGAFANWSDVIAISDIITYSDKGVPVCECNEINESLHEWKYVDKIDICWLELVGNVSGGIIYSMELPFYNEPYYWQRYGNFTEDVKTDCYLLWQTCMKHKDNLGCVWINGTSTCRC